MKQPSCARSWTTLLYGPRGSCKSLHMGREMNALFLYLQKRYKKYPLLHRAIVFTNLKLNKDLEGIHLGRDLYYFDDTNLETLRYCPRKNCWKGTEKHDLHGAYVFVDDISNLLPATDWASVPLWLRKMWIQGRKRGIHWMSTLVDPFDLVVQARRCVDTCFKLRALWKTRDPDETAPPLKRIFGWYQRRYISAEMLWKYGDLPEQIIQLRKIQQEELHDKLEEMDRAYAIVYDDSWYGYVHFFNESGRFPNWRWWRGLRVSSTLVYDTLQNIGG